MIAEIGRYLHQSIDEVEEWEAERFFRYHDQIGDIIADERPE